jgi:hypothetical protein
LSGSLRQNELRDRRILRSRGFCWRRGMFGAALLSEFESVLFEFHHRPELQFGVQICNDENSNPPRTRIIEFICLFLQGYLPEHESLVLFRHYVSMSIDFHLSADFDDVIMSRAFFGRRAEVVQMKIFHRLVYFLWALF